MLETRSERLQTEGFTSLATAEDLHGHMHLAHSSYLIAHDMMRHA